jgi:hypothetical protein
LHDNLTAGNLSTVVSDTIALDLYPPASHSANYRTCSTVVNTGGNTRSSAGLDDTAGEAVVSGAQPMCF